MLAIYRKRRPKAPAISYPEGKGNREVCSPTAAGLREYKRRTEEMRLRQCELCPICTLYLSKEDATFDHEFPRRMGGGFTDDRIWKVVDGVKIAQNFAVHGICNRAKGSQRLVISRVGEVA